MKNIYIYAKAFPSYVVKDLLSKIFRLNGFKTQAYKKHRTHKKALSPTTVDKKVQQ